MTHVITLLRKISVCLKAVIKQKPFSEIKRFLINNKVKGIHKLFLSVSIYSNSDFY